MRLTDERRWRGRRSRVVPTPDAGVKSCACSKGQARGDGGKQALAHQGERGI